MTAVAKGEKFAMPKITLVTVVIVAVLALAGDAAGSASATSWFVGGTKLPTGSKVELASKGEVYESSVLNVPTLSLKVSCTGLGVGGEIIGESSGHAALAFEGCSEIEPKTCRVNPSTVVTEPLTTTVTNGSAPDGKVLVTPRSGTLLTTLVFEGSCSLAGEKPVTGKVTLNAPTLQEELAEQVVEGLGSTENNSLEVAKNKAYIEKGKAGLALASGTPFGTAEGIFAWVKAEPNPVKFEGELEVSITKAVTFKNVGLLNTGVLPAALVTVPYSIVKDGCVGVVLKKLSGNTCEIEVLLKPKAMNTAGELIIPGYIRVPLVGKAP
jgi:hypothetical protein